VCVLALHGIRHPEETSLSGSDLEATMVTPEEVKAYQHDDGRITRAGRAALVWLVFYAVAATIGLAAKFGAEEATLLAALAPWR
jgi:hypothetical protein